MSNIYGAPSGLRSRPVTDQVDLLVVLAGDFLLVFLLLLLLLLL